MNYGAPRSRCSLCGESVATRAMGRHQEGAKCRGSRRPCGSCGHDKRRRHTGEWYCLNCERKKEESDG